MRHSWGRFIDNFTVYDLVAVLALAAMGVGLGMLHPALPWIVIGAIVFYGAIRAETPRPE